MQSCRLHLSFYLQQNIFAVMTKNDEKILQKVFPFLVNSGIMVEMYAVCDCAFTCANAAVICHRKTKDGLLLKRKTNWAAALRYLVYFTQFGLNMITPPVLYTFAAWWLRNRFDLGDWVVIVGILLGIATAGLNLWKFMQFTAKKAKESEREHKP